MAIRLPIFSSSATHCTEGLTGYPAIDFFGALGEDVFIGEGGSVVYPHLIPWHQGFGGWTFYYEGDSGSRYFVTHLDEGYRVAAGRLESGALIGHLARRSEDAALINGAHVHVGNTRWTGAGLSCGVAAPPLGSTATSPSRGPRVEVRGPRADGREGRAATFPEAFHHFVHAVGVTIPTRVKWANYASRRMKRAIR